MPVREADKRLAMGRW